jgi:hypothetical protein
VNVRAPPRAGEAAAFVARATGLLRGRDDLRQRGAGLDRAMKLAATVSDRAVNESSRIRFHMASTPIVAERIPYWVKRKNNAVDSRRPISVAGED